MNANDDFEPLDSYAHFSDEDWNAMRNVLMNDKSFSPSPISPHVRKECETKRHGDRRRKRQDDKVTKLEKALEELEIKQKSREDQVELFKSIIQAHVKDTSLTQLVNQPAHAMRKLIQDRQEVITHLFQHVSAYGGLDIREKLYQHCTTDMVTIHPNSTDELVGIDEFEKFIADMFTAFPDGTIQVLSMHHEGSHGQKWKVRFAFTGTQGDAYYGIQATNNKLTVHGHCIGHFRGTTLKISEQVWSWDAGQVIMSLLGISPKRTII